jgi:hypothetical protein
VVSIEVVLLFAAIIKETTPTIAVQTTAFLANPKVTPSLYVSQFTLGSKPALPAATSIKAPSSLPATHLPYVSVAEGDE